MATAEQHETAAMMFRGMHEIFYSRWDPDISAVELDCTDPKVLFGILCADFVFIVLQGAGGARGHHAVPCVGGGARDAL